MWGRSRKALKEFASWLAACMHRIRGSRRTWLRGSASALSLQAALATVAGIPPTPAAAQMVDDAVINPVTGTTERIVQVFPNNIVLTDANNLINLNTMVGATFPGADAGVVFTVTAVRVNATTMLVDQITVTDNADTPNVSMIDVVAAVDDTPPPDAIGDPGDPGGISRLRFPPGMSMWSRAACSAPAARMAGTPSPSMSARPSIR